MCSAVENPGVKMSSAAPAASTVSASPGAMRPRSTALRATRAGSTPRPSSRTSITTPLPAWRAETVSRPRGGLPAATRSSGGSRPWSSALRTRWTSGSPIASTTVRSSSVSWPTSSRSTSLPRRDARSRTSRGSRSSTASTGIIRTPMTSSWSACALRVSSAIACPSPGTPAPATSASTWVRWTTSSPIACRRSSRRAAGTRTDEAAAEDFVFGVDVSLGDTSTGRCEASAIVGVQRRRAPLRERGEQRVRVVGPDPELDRGSGEAVERLGVGLGALQRAVLGRLAEHHERPDRRHLGVVGQADGDVQAAGGRVLAHERPQAGDERGRVQPLAVAGLDAVDGRVERVDAGQQHVDGVAVEAVAPLAEQLEDVLHRVRQLRDGVVAHRRAHALERVGDAEDLVDRRPVVGPLLDADDREPEPLEVLARLGDEHREVLGDVHQPSRRYVCGRSGRRPSAAGSATRSVAPTSRTPPGRRVSASRACRSSRTPGVK